MLPVLAGEGVARPTAIISRVPAPVLGPVSTPQPVAVTTKIGVATAPAPILTRALPQPKIPTAAAAPVVSGPVGQPGPVAILTPAPAPVAPISVLSGSPIQTSIFQSTHTPTTVATQVDTEYQGPTDSALPLAQVSTPAAIGTETVAPPTGGTFFGIDQNSFWIILLLAVAILILVTL